MHHKKASTILASLVKFLQYPPLLHPASPSSRASFPPPSSHFLHQLQFLRFLRSAILLRRSGTFREKKAPCTSLRHSLHLTRRRVSFPAPQNSLHREGSYCHRSISEPVSMACFIRSEKKCTLLGRRAWKLDTFSTVAARSNKISTTFLHYHLSTSHVVLLPAPGLNPEVDSSSPNWPTHTSCLGAASCVSDRLVPPILQTPILGQNRQLSSGKIATHHSLFTFATVAASMESYGHVDLHPVVDPALKPPVLYDSSASASPCLGSMNYSPKHSRKPSLFLGPRNLNKKQLLLNLSPSSNNNTLPPRSRKPVALSISTPTVTLTPPLPPPPTQDSARSAFLLPVVANADISFDMGPAELFTCVLALQSPFGGHDMLSSRLSDVALGHGSADELKSADKGSDLPSNQPKPVLEAKSSFHESWGSNNSYQNTSHANHDLHSSPGRSFEPNDSITPPEELQERSNLHAYPNGPARVLNSTIYLYSDPQTSDIPVDVNAYDLVINVAKECVNLSLQFVSNGGKRSYVHVPWSHTSSILEELPRITKIIAEFDRPDRKILVHCQCGVLRSACVIVAYFMVKFDISMNEAYELLKTGTVNQAEPCNRRIAQEGYFVQGCDRICPNMSLIFELMDFGDRLKPSSTNIDDT